jgi:probable addiction module antidote protein
MERGYKEWLVESLHDKEEAAVYLQVALDEFQNDGDIEALLLALRHVAEAQGGVSSLAKKAHLNRESLYKTLSGTGNPQFGTMGRVLKGLGFKLLIRSMG